MTKDGATTLDTVNDYKPFVGASYFVSWYGLRLSVGYTFRITGGHDEAQRFLFQAGYMPTFDLF